MIIVINLFSIASVQNPLNLIINCIIFLGLWSALLWLFDLDVFVNFLIIIDLGVFFVLIAFLLNLTKLFQEYKTSPLALKSYSKKRSLTIILLFTILITSWIPSSLTSYNFHDSNVLNQINTSIQGPLLYDWNSIFNFVYFSDLQLMSDIYFHTNLFEFVIMNVFIYLALIIIITVLNSKDWLFQLSPNTNESLGKYEKHIYMRAQNLQFQIKRSATVRVLSRSYFDKIKNDSALNLSTLNR